MKLSEILPIPDPPTTPEPPLFLATHLGEFLDFVAYHRLPLPSFSTKTCAGNHLLPDKRWSPTGHHIHVRVSAEDEEAFTQWMRALNVDQASVVSYPDGRATATARAHLVEETPSPTQLPCPLMRIEVNLFVNQPAWKSSVRWDPAGHDGRRQVFGDVHVSDLESAAPAGAEPAGE